MTDEYPLASCDYCIDEPMVLIWATDTTDRYVPSRFICRECFNRLGGIKYFQWRGYTHLEDMDRYGMTLNLKLWQIDEEDKQTKIHKEKTS